MRNQMYNVTRDTMDPRIILFLLILIPAVILHEVAHGLAALALGDKTAKNLGRLTLNPIKHIDPFGSIILPFILVFLGLPVLGYAKPVPIDPRYFQNQRKGMMLTALAGPSTNLSIAVICSVLFKVVSNEMVGAVLVYIAFINLMLGVFNLLPIPPFDGSKVVQGILPKKVLPIYYKIEYYTERYIFIVILVLIMLPGSLFRILSFIINPIIRLLGLPINV